MKANEAPEKIFLEKEKETDRIHHLWGKTPVISSLYEHIEYTRTDAFIEKAISWLKEQDEMVGISFQEDFLERFQNHMKEE